MKLFKRSEPIKIMESSNVIQFDDMGYPLRLVIDNEDNQLWLDTNEREGDVELKWRKRGASNEPTIKKIVFGANSEHCNCGGVPLEQAGIEAGINTSVYRIECSSCKKRTLWHDKEKCAWCEWDELQKADEDEDCVKLRTEHDELLRAAFDAPEDAPIIFIKPKEETK